MTPILGKPGRRTLLAVAAATLPTLLRPRKLAAAPHAGLPSADALPPTGTAIPDISWTDADGNRRTLADYAGKAVVLNFWATWCIPCVAEMPALAKLATLVDAQRVAVLPLSSDRTGAEAVRRFYDKETITTLPILLDPRGDALHALNVRGIPTTVLIDTHGRERARLEGTADWTDPAAIAAINELTKG